MEPEKKWIKWVLSFERAKEMYDKMWEDKIYVNEAANKQIETMLRKNGKFNKSKTMNFGDLSQPVADINAGDFYIQHRNVTSGVFQDLDGMVAALANFSFRMAVQGNVTYKETQETYFGFGENKDVYTVQISKVGIYIRDSYDFIGSQLGGLGHWNPDTNKVSKSAFNGSHEVNNATFREWRMNNECGGDFIIFSDIEIREVNESWEVEI